MIYPLDTGVNKQLNKFALLKFRNGYILGRHMLIYMNVKNSHLICNLIVNFDVKM